MVKRSIVLDYGSDELEVRCYEGTVDLIIRDGEGVVWAIKGIKGKALAALKEALIFRKKKRPGCAATQPGP